MLFCRKRSGSGSSRSSSDDSIDIPKRRKKNNHRKLDEVERLAEMERQRRQKEVEHKVGMTSMRKFFFYIKTFFTPLGDRRRSCTSD